MKYYLGIISVVLWWIPAEKTNSLMPIIVQNQMVSP